MRSATPIVGIDCVAQHQIMKRAGPQRERDGEDSFLATRPIASGNNTAQPSAR